MENTWGISPLGVNFLKKQEGYRPRAYSDFKQWSSGYGTRSRPGEVIDQAEAERRLMAETGKVSDWLRSNVTAPLSENQEDALVSAGYNLGTGPKGLARLLGDINASEWDRVASRLQTFNKAGGQVNEGLVNRRKAEAEMLLGKPLPNAYLGGTAAAPAGGPASAAPLPQMPAPPSGRYSKLADMLMASAAGAKPKGWGELLNAVGDLGLGYSLANKHDEAEKGYRSKLSEALMGAKDPDALTNTLLASGDPSLQSAAVNLKVSQLKPQAPLRGKERFLVTPNGVMDVETNAIVPGTEPKSAAGKPPAGYRQTDGGNLEFIPGGPADPATNNRQVKYNEGQTKAANFGRMMTEAEKLIGEQANPMGFWGQLRENLAPEAVNNQMRSPEQQTYRQAADQWIRAKLRKESGATITPEESEGEFRTFFPAPGDGPEVVAQKKLARQQAIQGMIAESGGAYDQLFAGQAAPAAPAAPPPAAAPPAAKQQAMPRPQGLTDEQIIQEAFQAIRNGKDEAAVRKQVEEWGVRF